jgi:hypothetical protein
MESGIVLFVIRNIDRITLNHFSEIVRTVIKGGSVIPELLDGLHLCWTGSTGWPPSSLLNSFTAFLSTGWSDSSLLNQLITFFSPQSLSHSLGSSVSVSIHSDNQFEQDVSFERGKGPAFLWATQDNRQVASCELESNSSQPIDFAKSDSIGPIVTMEAVWTNAIALCTSENRLEDGMPLEELLSGDCSVIEPCPWAIEPLSGLSPMKNVLSVRTYRSCI